MNISNLTSYGVIIFNSFLVQEKESADFLTSKGSLFLEKGKNTTGSSGKFPSKSKFLLKILKGVLMRTIDYIFVS